MKNIHVLATDKPSTLIKDLWKNTFFLVGDFATNHTDFKAQHIYITSAEEIKEGDYCLSKLNEIVKFHSGYDYRYYAKIILTTDQDLIKDGVQAIDDEFLEWFVKNPSCESVTIRKKSVVKAIVKGIGIKNFDNGYKIIIPKEEQKQHLIDMMKSDEELGLYDEPKTKCYCGHTITCDCGPEQHVDFINSNIDEFDKALKLSKQETLEDASWKYNPLKKLDGEFLRHAFKEGAKWQQERMYSEEEVFNLLMEFSSRDINSSSRTPHSVANWFEKLKKK